MLRVRSRTPLDGRYEALPYQAEAVRATKDLEYAALFHEQGLGKTKIALDLVLHWLASGAVDSVLTVTKKALVENWERETQLHTYLRPIILAQDRRANFYAFNRPGRFYLSHYEVMHSERGRLQLFAKARRLGVILDEAQRIKNPSSRPAIALHALAPNLTRRVIMTGTPVANRPYDLWSQVYFLDLGASLGKSFATFKSELDLKKEFELEATATTDFEDRISGVYRKINGFTVRKTKRSAEINLPEKTIRNTTAHLEPVQRSLYDEYRDDLAAEISRDDVRTVDDAETVLKRLLRLVQTASNPRLIDNSYSATPGKLNILDIILGEKDNAGPKTVVWTAFTGNVDMIARHYAALRPARVHGRRTISDRNKELRRFVEDPACRLLVATPGAAKEGLTLTIANHAIFFDRTFSLDDYLQAQDRIHRISQTSSCLVENIVASETVDDWIDELLSAKQLAAALTQGDIDIEEYRGRATYAFNRVLRQILGPREE